MNQSIEHSKPSIFFENRPRRRSLDPELREIVHESRMHDLENIREITRYSLIPLITLSFIGGYFLSTILLKPLEYLNLQIYKTKINNLNKKIDFIDKGDEISELIKNFNFMSIRLSKAFESQKQFVENASHEIKTPLSIIQANLDTVLDKQEISIKERDELLKNAKKQIAYMNNLTEDLFLLSHMSSKSDVQMDMISIEDVIKKAILDLQNNAKKNNINIIFKPIDKNIQILGNSILLERALSNVISNSIKYSKGNKIKIQLKEISNYVLIEILDNGKGISSKNRDKVFERFYRIDKGRSKKEGGCGLGLAITKEIIKRHSGNILLDKNYTKGAKFIIKIPKNQNP